MNAAAAIEIVHDVPRSRFTASVDGLLSRLEYRLTNGVMDIHHTEVPVELGGRGIGGKLVEAAIAHARANDLRVTASCTYARAWMQRHPQSLDLLLPADRTWVSGSA